jgi:hypothetical protein
LKRRTGSTSASPSISIEHVQVAQIEKNTITVDILISGESLGQKKIVETTTLLDTGAGEKFIDQNFVRNQKIEMKELKYPIEVFNVDGTPNKRAMELAIKENKKKADLPVEKLIPEDLHDFLDVFDDNKANQFPESNVWHHKIDMKEGFEPKSFKNYNLTPEEQKELDKFLDENLEKGYIRPSQSLQASPFFFVKKKDGRL